MHDGSRRIDAEKLLAESRWASRLARSLVRDDAVAQDVVQSALVAALESAPSAEGRLRPWLARVVRNFAAQSLRSDAHRTAREHATARAERSPSAAETAERLESQRVLVEALAALEEPYRTTVTLRYLEGLSAAQIARRERVPAGTVRWRLSEGLDRLRARLDRSFRGERGAWALALLPILKRPPLGGLVAGGAAGALEGVLMMNTMLKLGFAAALVAAASVGVYLSVDHGVPPASPLAASAKTAAATDLSGIPQAGTSALADADTSSVRATVALEAKVPAPVATAESKASRLLARCVDPTGAPLAGVRLEVRSFPNAVATSAGDGRLSLEVEIPDANDELWIVASLPSRATRFERVVLDRGKTTDLGDLMMEPGGAVAGVVVGPNGDPIAGAEVLVTKPEFEDRLEALQRRGPRHAPYDPPVLSGTTDTSGSFLLEGVPARSVRVWAGAPGMRFTCTDPIDVAAGTTRSDLRLALKALAAEDVIEGVVLDPDGAPVGSASVLAYWNGGFSSGAYSGKSDAGGHFQIRLREPVAHDLKAADPMGRWPELLVPGVRPGAQGVELRFAPGREFELRVRSRGGHAVANFDVMLRPTDGEHFTGYNNGGVHEGGVVRIPAPPRSFFFEVLAPGHARRRMGPFEPTSVPAVIECELDPLPGVRGRVVATGRPVAGARVEVHALAQPGSRIVSDGFPSRLDPSVTDSAQTDEQGRFDLTVREAGTYAIVAEAEGLATTELSPVEIDPANGVDGLEIGMTTGGSIEGRVLLGGGRDPAGTIVAASRGDGYPRTVRVGADGSFRFDRLMPGRWNVTRADREVRIRGEMAMFSIAKEPQEATWNCTVAEGRATRFDLDLRNEQACVVAAQVAFGDRPVQGWTLSIETSGELETTGAGLDEHGRARVEVERPGSYILALRTAGERFDARFNRRTELARGETAWNLDVAVGGVEGRVPAATEGNLARLLYTAELGNGVTFDAWITTDENGRFRLPFAPAGKASIFRITDDQAAGRNVASTRQVEVKAGEVLTVDVD